jgi:hypothetical protein
MCGWLQLECLSTAGTYCPAQSPIWIICPISGFCNTTLMPIFHNCTAGSYCATQGLTKVTALCSGGYYCPSGSSSAQQNTCIRGYYCPLGSPAMIIWYVLCFGDVSPIASLVQFHLSFPIGSMLSALCARSVRLWQCRTGRCVREVSFVAQLVCRCSLTVALASIVSLAPAQLLSSRTLRKLRLIEYTV